MRTRAAPAWLAILLLAIVSVLVAPVVVYAIRLRPP
jgi:hypothetical protein